MSVQSSSVFITSVLPMRDSWRAGVSKTDRVYLASFLIPPSRLRLIELMPRLDVF